MAIYTRGGDGGETSLADGDRVIKSNPRVEAVGALDEANCAVGVAAAMASDPVLADVLAFAQQRLFNCSSRVATPPRSRSDSTPSVDAEDVLALERAIDRFVESTGPLRGFVLPGGSELSAALHVARATVRRAERKLVALGAADDGDFDCDVARFVNRLSDVLFSAARYALVAENAPETLWNAEAPRPDL